MTSAATSCHLPCRAATCPPWLQAALADIEQRVRDLGISAAAPAAAGAEPDSFAERAENYYQKRPQLISLLHDLHNRYLYLADRYSQSLLKAPQHRRLPSAASATASSEVIDEDDDGSLSSDVESSLSFQPPPPQPEGGGCSGAADLDALVVELVMAAVERELALDELETERLRRSKKIELQRSLVEVLESERLVLLGENARLGFRAAAAEEEARYMRAKAAELARIAVAARSDLRVCALSRRIEGLQAQIYGLERRNRECCEGMARREVEKGEGSAEIDKLRAENRRLRAAAKRKERRGWWDRIRRIEWGPCAAPQHGCFQW